MSTIQIEESPFTYHLEDERFICDHNDISIEKACCTTIGANGYIECGCGGIDTIQCENPECTGFDSDSLPDFNDDCWD